MLNKFTLFVTRVQLTNKKLCSLPNTSQLLVPGILGIPWPFNPRLGGKVLNGGPGEPHAEPDKLHDGDNAETDAESQQAAHVGEVINPA